MNGAGAAYMRRGHLLTALAAAVLLAASPGIASAQSVGIGFTASSGSISETASTTPDALQEPLEIRIRVSGLLPVADSRRTTTGLGTVTLTSDGPVSIAQVTRTDPRANVENITAAAGGTYRSGTNLATLFANTDEVTLVVSQSATGKDDNWLSEEIKLTLDAGSGVDVNPAVYTINVQDVDVAPVAKFVEPNFTLTEGSARHVHLDIVSGTTGRNTGLPPGAEDVSLGTNAEPIIISVSNPEMVTVETPSLASDVGSCPAAPSDRKPFHFVLRDAWPASVDDAAFRRTGRLQTIGGAGASGSITAIASVDDLARIRVISCAVSGFRDQQVTLTILPDNLVELPNARVRGDFTIGAPLTITIDSEEETPTLSFSPTDVTIDEGGETSTRLIADGMSATEVGMVKLMVEGDAMVDLYHDDMMLEEMDGYVTVDLGRGNSARLTAMSTSDPDLMDGDMAYKAWKLMEGSSDAAIGDDYWFRVDVRGSTAVPALPLVGQLLLALFLMAGGSRLYRRRRG